MTRALLIVAAAGLLASSRAIAQEYVEEPPWPTEEYPSGEWEAPPDPTLGRHVGFFFRADLGFGYLSTSAVVPVDGGRMRASISGFAVSFGVTAGGAIAENLILAGEAWISSVDSPTFTSGGQSFRSDNASLDLFGIGLQLTYWFMPANAYLSVTPSFSTLGTTEGNVTTEAQPGFGLKVALGKEWWIGGHWGLGVAGQFFFGANADAGAPGPVTWTTLGGSVAITGTYN